MNKWYTLSGGDNDVVVSTRVRLARNIREFPFSNTMKDEQRQKLLDTVKAAIFPPACDQAAGFVYTDMAALSDTDAAALVEEHLISPEFAAGRQGRGLIRSEDGHTVIMIGEEDHLRIQVIYPGFAIKQAYKLADQVDDLFDERLPYAYHEKLGFLTKCPTNLGTGLRISVMVHLPALEATGNLSGIIRALGGVGLTVRGMYGEGSSAAGSLYQISNQVTLGVSEEQVQNKMISVIEELAGKERAARKSLQQTHATALEDRVMRSFGALAYARLLPTKEFMQLISNVRMGVCMGLLPGYQAGDIDALTIAMQPDMLMRESGNMSAGERDKKRAAMVSAFFTGGRKA